MGGRVYQFVGDAALLEQTEFVSRAQLVSQEALAGWLSGRESEIDLEGMVAATFIVDCCGTFWIADQRSEHVSCARHEGVLAAGEAYFCWDDPWRIARITNQSTGYCPEPSSWSAVAEALADTGIAFPDAFEPSFVFRRCPKCGSITIVKEEDFTCLDCGVALPTQWNL